MTLNLMVSLPHDVLVFDDMATTSLTDREKRILKNVTEFIKELKQDLAFQNGDLSGLQNQSSGNSYGEIFIGHPKNHR